MPHRLLLCLFFTCVKILIFSYPKCTETRAICTLAVKRTLDWPVLPANQMGMFLTDAEMELSNKQLKLTAKSPRKKIVPNLRQFFRKRLIWVTRYKMRYSLHDKKNRKTDTHSYTYTSPIQCSLEHLKTKLWFLTKNINNK